MDVGKNISYGVFDSFDDEQLADAARTDELAMLLIITRMMSLIIYMANTYSKNKASDKDDLVQECLIALVYAVRSFSSQGGASFRTYAGICMKNRINSYLRSIYRQNKLPLNYNVSINSDNGSELAQEGGVFDNTNPEELIIIREELSNVWKLVKSSLSDFELRVFVLHLCGLSYADIAKKMETSNKAVDNALQRVRRKIKKMTAGKDFK